jgi:hypothetical protein
MTTHLDNTNMHPEDEDNPGCFKEYRESTIRSMRSTIMDSDGPSPQLGEMIRIVDRYDERHSQETSDNNYDEFG